MQTLRTAVIALSALALSSAALAHGHAYGHARYRHETRRVVIVEPRYEGRYEQRCESPQRVVYVPAREARRPVVAIQPGIRVQLAFGF